MILIVELLYIFIKLQMQLWKKNMQFVEKL